MTNGQIPEEIDSKPALALDSGKLKAGASGEPLGKRKREPEDDPDGEINDPV